MKQAYKWAIGELGCLLLALVVIFLAVRFLGFLPYARWPLGIVLGIIVGDRLLLWFHADTVPIDKR